MSVADNGGFMSSEKAYSGIAVLEVMAEAQKYNRYLLSLIEALIKPGDKVLDFGAGCGTFAIPLQKAGIDLTCLEPDATLNATLQTMGVCAIRHLNELPNCSVDCVYTFNVLEHIRDDQGTLRVLADKLKSGGRMLVYVPAFQVLYSTFDRRVGHLRRYRRGALAKMLAAAGLSVQEAAYVDCLGFFAALLYRVIAKEGGELSPIGVKMFDRWIFPVSRIMDAVLWRFIGKNVMIIARKL